MKKYSSDFVYRPLGQNDISGAMHLKDEAGWNQTVDDWQVFLAGEQNVNYAAVDGERLVGTVTGINYENKVAWIGMMIVDEAYRGKGISKKLMTLAIEGLRQNCASIKLDATPLGLPVYAKLGFHEEYTILRMVNPCVDALPSTDIDRGGIRPVTENDSDGIIELDRQIFGAGRSDLISQMINRLPEKSFLFEDKDRITGFVIGREGTRFVQIGPVTALREKDAEILITKALGDLKGSAVVIDVPEDKAGIISMLKTIGFEVQRPLYRMYLEKNLFPGKPEYQYAICGPEFG